MRRMAIPIPMDWIPIGFLIPIHTSTVMVLWLYFCNYCIIACFVRLRQNYKDVGYVIFSSIRGIRASTRFQLIYVNTQKWTEHLGCLLYNDFQTTIVHVVRRIKTNIGQHRKSRFSSVYIHRQIAYKCELIWHAHRLVQATFPARTRRQLYSIMVHVNGSRYYTALECVIIASALFTAVTIYPCQIRVHQRWQSKLQLLRARKKEWRPATADSSPQTVTCQHCDTQLHTTLVGLQPTTFR